MLLLISSDLSGEADVDDGDQWCDLLLMNQPIFKLNGAQVENEVMEWDETPRSIHPGSLLKVFPFGQEMLVLNEISCGLERRGTGLKGKKTSIQDCQHERMLMDNLS